MSCHCHLNREAQEELARRIAQCDEEIRSMAEQQNAPAWLVTLGMEDWEQERRLLMRESATEPPQ